MKYSLSSSSPHGDHWRGWRVLWKQAVIPALHCFQTLASMNVSPPLISLCPQLEQTPVVHKQWEVKSPCQRCFLMCCRSGCTQGFQQGGSQWARAWQRRQHPDGDIKVPPLPAVPASRATSHPSSCAWKYPLQKPWEDVICFPQGWCFCQVFLLEDFLLSSSGSSSSLFLSCFSSVLIMGHMHAVLWCFYCFAIFWHPFSSTKKKYCYNPIFSIILTVVRPHRKECENSFCKVSILFFQGLYGQFPDYTYTACGMETSVDSM